MEHAKTLMEYCGEEEENGYLIFVLSLGLAYVEKRETLRHAVVPRIRTS